MSPGQPLWRSSFAPGVTAIRGDIRRAAAQITAAAAAFDAVNMPLYAASARRRLGEIIGGDDGEALVSDADLLMTSRGVRQPARLTAMYAPGLVSSA